MQLFSVTDNIKNHEWFFFYKNQSINENILKKKIFFNEHFLYPQAFACITNTRMETMTILPSSERKKNHKHWGAAAAADGQRTYNGSVRENTFL